MKSRIAGHRSPSRCGNLAAPWPARLVPAALLALVLAVPAQGQSLLDRPPVSGGTWTGRPGTVHFNFLHHFRVSDPPARKVTNSPTFLFAASLPGRTLAGARYATSSDVLRGVPNEWEFFGRWNPVAESLHHPLDASLHVAYNEAARSLDGEIALARRWGRLRLLAAGRVLGDAYGSGETRAAAGGGAVVRLSEFVALGAGASSLLERDSGEKISWSAGLLLAIPYTPHTLSLHLTNVNTNTLQGLSRGQGETRYGFTFTVPINLSRYFGGREERKARVDVPGTGRWEQAAARRDTVEIGMTDDLRYTPDRARVVLGQTVRWTNTSDMLHTVTADPDLALYSGHVHLPEGAVPFDSGYMKPGQVFRWTPRTAGEYKYFCIPHENDGMIGTVVVVPPPEGGPDSGGEKP